MPEGPAGGGAAGSAAFLALLDSPLLRAERTAPASEVAARGLGQVRGGSGRPEEVVAVCMRHGWNPLGNTSMAEWLDDRLSQASPQP